MNVELKFFDKYYVGFQQERYTHADSLRTLGFATPDTNDAAGAKRKATVDSWADKKLAPITIENTPQHGFKVVDAVTRYSTDNKKYRVLDPRGFELEITAYNLLDIILKHTLVNGTIMEPMVWARNRNDNYLVSGNSEEYKKRQGSPGVVKVEMVAGNYFRNQVGNVVYKFVGKFYYSQFGVSTRRDAPYRPHSSWLGRYQKDTTEDYSQVRTSVTAIVKKTNDKPIFAYLEYTKDRRDGGYNLEILFRKSALENVIPLSPDEVQGLDLKPYTLQMNTLIKEHGDKGIRINHNLTTCGDYKTNGFCLFETRGAMKSRAYIFSEIYNLVKPLCIDRHYDYHEQGPLSETSPYWGKITREFKEID